MLLLEKARAALRSQGFRDSDISVEPFLNLRYEGTNTSVITPRPSDDNYERVFKERYQREYGFLLTVRIGYRL